MVESLGQEVSDAHAKEEYGMEKISEKKRNIYLITIAVIKWRVCVHEGRNCAVFFPRFFCCVFGETIRSAAVAMRNCCLREVGSLDD